MDVAEVEATIRTLVEQMPGSQAYYKVMLDALFLHWRKSRDYTGNSVSPFANFIESAMENDQSPAQVLDGLLGVKRSRRRALRRSGHEALNESLRDTTLDEINYLALRQALHETHPEIFDKVLHITAETVL